MITKISNLSLNELQDYGNNALKFYKKNFNNDKIINTLIEYL